MNIFLGNPPENIKQWIIDHYTPPTPPARPLCFTAEQDGSSVSLIGWDTDMNEQIGIFASLQYSTDNSTWKEWDGHVINLATGEKVYIKALNSNPDGMAYYNETFGYVTKYHKFIFEGKIAASGNIQYLLEDTGSRTDVPAYAYYHMLDGCTSLASAPELPATTLADCCYDSMFYDCSNLTQAPALLATTLADYCYASMFFGCSNLTQAPALPATTLADSCYNYMFYRCSSLTAAPALPATTLANSCYSSMFRGCTSIASAPELLATTLANSCYSNMFYGCDKFSNCHMKASMKGVYNKSTHGDTMKTVIYDL